MSTWQELKTERNRQSVARLAEGVPADFSADRIAARARPSVQSPTPRLARIPIGAHIRCAHRLARALAAKSGAPDNWTWRLADKRKRGLPATFRTPPAPYRETKYARRPLASAVSRFFVFGWHVDTGGGGPNRNATWHCACVITWQFWNAPSGEAPLRRLQARRCVEGGTGNPPRSTIACDFWCGASIAIRMAGAARPLGFRTCR